MQKIKKFIVKNYATILLVVILLIGAFMRLYRIDEYMVFLGDEGRDMLVAREILHGNFTLLGPRASAGDFYLGPIYYYMIAPFLFITNYNAVGPSIMVALFGVVTVYLVYRVGKEFFGTTSGLTASLLYAISPLVIIFSRSSWNPNVLPFFSILTIYSTYKAVVQKNKWLFVLAGVLLGISVQLHYLALFLGGVVGLFILGAEIFDKSKKTIFEKIGVLAKQYLFTFIGFIIGFSPFLLFEVRHNFPNFRTIVNFIFFSGEVSSGSNFTTIIGDVFFRLFARLITQYPTDPANYSKDLLSSWYIFTLIIAFSTSALIFYQFVKSLKEKKNEHLKYLVVIIWFVFGVLFFGLYKKSIYDYYFAFLFPVPFLLTANLIAFPTLKKNLVSIISAALLLLLVFLAWNVSPVKIGGNSQYNQVKTIAEFVLSKTDGKPYNFALISGGNSDHAYRYFFELANMPPTTIQNPEVDPDRKSVQDQLLVVCEENPCQPLGNSLWEIAGFGRAEIIGEWPVSVLKVYKLSHYEEKSN